jgi:quinol monooxygenase YgiN
MLHRRTILAGAMGAALVGCAHATEKTKEAKMYGLIGSITATPGQGDTLAGYLLEGLRDMPGNLSYIVAKDPANPDKLWITEVWDSAESHMASLKLPQVQAAIAKARPIIAGMGDRQETVPVGGVGLK